MFIVFDKLFFFFFGCLLRIWRRVLTTFRGVVRNSFDIFAYILFVVCIVIIFVLFVVVLLC